MHTALFVFSALAVPALLISAAPLTDTTLTRRGDMNGNPELSKQDSDACKLKGPVNGADFVWGENEIGTSPDGHGTFERGPFLGFGGGNNDRCAPLCGPAVFAHLPKEQIGQKVDESKISIVYYSCPNACKNGATKGDVECT